MAAVSARIGVQRRSVCAASSTVAAWFARRGGDTTVLVVNHGVCTTPATCHLAESWFRLDALTRRHLFGVLLAVDVVAAAPLMDGLVHVPI